MVAFQISELSAAQGRAYTELTRVQKGHYTRQRKAGETHAKAIRSARLFGSDDAKPAKADAKKVVKKTTTPKVASPAKVTKVVKASKDTKAPKAPKMHKSIFTTPEYKKMLAATTEVNVAGQGRETFVTHITDGQGISYGRAYAVDGGYALQAPTGPKSDSAPVFATLDKAREFIALGRINGVIEGVDISAKIKATEAKQSEVDVEDGDTITLEIDDIVDNNDGGKDGEMYCFACKSYQEIGETFTLHVNAKLTLTATTMVCGDTRI